MKIAAAQPRPRVEKPSSPTAAPVVLDSLGCARLVWMLPAGEAAWIGLTDRLPTNGAWLATRLSVTAERVDVATAATANALRHIGDRRRAGEPVPAAWIARLADLEVAELEALIALDDAAAAASVCPAWVEVAPTDRAVPAEERSWVRVSRILARLLQQVAGMELPDALYDEWVAMDVALTPDEATVETVTNNARAALRWVVAAHYGGETT